MTDGTVCVWDSATGRQLAVVPTEVKPGSMTERVRGALDKVVKIEAWNGQLPLADVLEYLKKRAGTDFPIRGLQIYKSATAVDLMAGELPLSAWLLAIEDTVPDLCFVVREYGLLVTTKDRLPDGAVRLRAFLNSAPHKAKEEPGKQ